MSTCCPSIFVRPLREIIFPQPVASNFVLAEEAVLTTPQIAPSLLAKWDYWSSLCSMSGSRQTHTHTHILTLFQHRLFALKAPRYPLTDQTTSLLAAGARFPLLSTEDPPGVKCSILTFMRIVISEK